ncbi:MAG: glycerol-3-phosphate 1-O-acyltransferase PlsY [Clostridiales Family XIII bacterium]|jgi:glycerol-3-phosphate acyltransferase PlsY|nr:glycerol-3-phosphate 1-O-acyltransferase PlsY [Clostridiales Family XIII bacterium]
MTGWAYIAVEVVVCVGAYFVGNINGAILVGKAYGVDVREQGSGNAGTTNALRSIGKRAGAITFAIDVAKGWVVYFAVGQFFPYGVTMLCGLCVVLGHMYPVVFRFRGGKGVATTFGVLLAANWVFALLLLGVVAVFTLLFRRVSLSVMIAVAAGLVLCATEAGGIASGVYWKWLAVLFALIVWKHRSNIARLLKGQEPKLTFGSK